MTRLTRIILLVGLIVAVTVPFASSQADMSASSITNVTPNPVTEGATFDISFTVDFESTDNQTGDWFSITVPSEWTINSIADNPLTGTYPGAVTQSISGQTLIWNDVDMSDPGLFLEDTFTFMANVTVNACVNAPWTLPYVIGGGTDAGDDPDVSGSVVITASGTCTTPAPVTPGSGNDMIDLPDTAVVGKFVDYTPLYFTPFAGGTSDYSMEPGQSLYVFGVDSSGKFYKVLMSGQFYWVPVETMGPNYDDVWNGMPLPTLTVS